MRIRDRVVVAVVIFVAVALAGRVVFAVESQGAVRMKSDAAGRVEIAVGGAAVVSGLSPLINLENGALSVDDGGLAAGEATATSGDDDLGKHDVLTISYLTKDGQKALTMVLRARKAGEVALVTAELSYEGTLKINKDVPVRLVMSMPGFRRAQCSELYGYRWWTQPKFIDKPDATPDQTQFFLWDAGEAGIGALIPLVGGGMKGYMTGVDGFGLSYTALDGSFVPKGFPAFALAFGKDPYENVRQVYIAGMYAMGKPGNLRVNKAYPDMFEYFGYDSWNAYYREIDRGKVIDVAKSFKQRNFPVRWMTIDDGWQVYKGRVLIGFEANEKFPGGLASVISELKKTYGFRWIGILQTIQLLWGGIDPESPLAVKYKDYLFKTADGRLIPDPLGVGSYVVMDDYHKYLRGQGLDFVKVDYQSSLAETFTGLVPISYGVETVQHNLQASVGTNFGYRMINCMSMSVENVYNWSQSNIARASDDFSPGQPTDPQRHIIDNIYNSLWQSQLAYPDFDMFQSYHFAADYHAALRAISGGPIYVTDSPYAQRWDLLWKFVYPNGRILRADQPAMPTRDVLFEDTSKTGSPLKAFTRVGAMGVVAAFNARYDDGDAKGRVSPADVYELKGDRFAAFEHFSGRLTALGAGESLPVELPKQKAALYHFSPISDGFAPVGLANKLLSGRAVLHTVFAGGEWVVDVASYGKFVAWMESRPAAVFVDGKPTNDWTWEADKLTVTLPKKSSSDPIEVRIKR